MVLIPNYCDRFTYDPNVYYQFVFDYLGVPYGILRIDDQVETVIINYGYTSSGGDFFESWYDFLKDEKVNTHSKMFIHS